MDSFLIDTHIHTNLSPCASITLEETLNGLIDRVDAIIVTDHDLVQNIPKNFLDSIKSKYEINILQPALEISTAQGHILGYGISSAPSFYLDAKEVIEIIHNEGGIAVAAHPFALLGLDELIFSLEIDAIEINGSRSSRINQMAKEAAEVIGLPLIGGSDSHTSYHVGTCVTKFQKEIKTMSDFIEEVKKGNCQPLFLTHRGSKD
ncbi:MAG: PHP-associated domain-containing protein [Candidatus Thorarchaeota archaeon]